MSKVWSRRKFITSSLVSAGALGGLVLASGKVVAQGQPSEKTPASKPSDPIEDKVKQIIATQLHLDPAKVVPNARIMGELGGDSLDAVEIVLTLEKTFALKIPDEDVERMNTVRQVVDYVRSRVQPQKNRRSPQK